MKSATTCLDYVRQGMQRLAAAGPALISGVCRGLRNDAGNVAIIFGIAALPIIVATGAAVDLSRAYLVKSRLTQALDAAGLATGSAVGLTQSEMEKMAHDYFDANYPEEEIGVPGNLTVSVLDNVITLSAIAEVQTALMSVVGIDKIEVASEVEITRESKGLEVVLVLDNTGSMGSNGKIDALKTATNDLIQILFGDKPYPDKLKMGMVPFAAAVNVGSEHYDAGFVDINAVSSIHGENFDGSPNIFDLYDEIQNRDWAGCVETRPYPLDEDDSPPDLADGDTFWVPYFAPDEPDSWGYPNRYLDDETSGTAAERQRDTGKYQNAWVSSWSKGPQNGCGMAPITPLTNDRDLLYSRVEDMVATGYTHIPIGLAWGWRLLSPTEPFTEGTGYDDNEYTKAIILLTDGQNTIPNNGTHNKSQYTAYGYLATGRLGTTNAWNAQNELDNKLGRICENVKEKKIRVYTITFQLNDTATQNLMRDCATDPELYFNSPSNEELRQVFQNIAQDLSNLRVSR